MKKIIFCSLIATFTLVFCSCATMEAKRTESNRYRAFTDAMYGNGSVFPVYALDSRERLPNQSEREQIELVSAIFRSHGYTISDDPDKADYLAYWKGSLKENDPYAYKVTGYSVSPSRSYTHMMVANFSKNGEILWSGGSVIVKDHVDMDMLYSRGIQMAFENFPYSK